MPGAGTSSLLHMICLLLAGMAIYGGTLGHGFHFDDWNNIENNPNIRMRELSLAGLQKAGFNEYSLQRPVAYITFALNYFFHGLDVRGYHVVNILIHLLSAVLLYAFVRSTLGIASLRERYGEPGAIAFFTALIWLVHPVQTQSVTYIVQRMNSMGGMFFIMAMWFYVKARTADRRGIGALFVSASFIAGLLAFGSKENTVTLPFIILLYEWYFFQVPGARISGKRLLQVLAAGVLLAAIAFLLTGNGPVDRFIAGYDQRPFTLGQRLLTEPRVILHYISLLFYPHPARLNFEYDFPVSASLFTPVTTLLSLGALAGFVSVAVFLARKNRLSSFCILWFLGNLAIESSIIPLEIIYEHRLYLPSMTGIFLIVLFLHQTIKNKKAVCICLATVAVLFSFWTYERNKVWQDELSLWSDCRQKSPGNPRVNLSLGLEYFKQGRLDEAAALQLQGLTLLNEELKSINKPDYAAVALYIKHLGNTYKEQKKFQGAIAAYEEALRFFFHDAETHFLLGQCLLETGELDRAVLHLSKAVEFAGRHAAGAIGRLAPKLYTMYLDRARKLLGSQIKRE